ncbi:secreted chorismate mutase (plasmid) [Mycolicibacterium arabiense]|uniref:Chorismate mutase n=1 Tax=Mycolicibacterium arabiense TaxID=1286181 RepID=A0A7I7RQF5_9MYCO|nr:chorismate mutase [Mycolicibacterium arabiense]MCV7372177.1 chorismate mutase [Mycolicibacterium arabiense]BBY46802.1 secreted chorismate mutase [Mycolicibacterium arabiense]
MSSPSRVVRRVIVSCLATTVSLTASASIAAADEPSPLARLVTHAAERLQTADPVAASKFHTGGAVDDPAREDAVIDAVTAAATAHQVDAEFVHRVFRDQIDATDSLEHSRFAQWKIDPASVPRDAPDLSSLRNDIDRLNEAMVEDMADAGDALHAASCPSDLAKAEKAAVAAKQLDELYARALHFAVHDYCQGGPLR